MAGKTLPGIGDDESGEHDASDSSDPLRSGDKAKGLSSSDKTPSPRATDRMHVGIPTSPTRTIIGGPAMIDEDKVAEGLKKLRSLDEPLGPIPNSMPTLKEGIPVVPGLPVPVVTPGMAAAEQARTRGTAHGHALSTPAVGQGLVPMTVDDRLKGTLLGHSLHLPDLPSPPEENRAPEVRAIATVAPRATPSGTHPAGDHTDFSHGDARFFESQPLSTELEPEHPRSTKVVRGIAIFTAVISVFVVAAYAWSHSHKSESAETTAPETKPPAAEPGTDPAPATATPTPENAAAAPAGTPEAVPAAVAPTTPPAAAIVPTPPTPTPAAAPAEAEETPSAKLKRQVAAANAAKSPPPTPRPRSSRAAEPSRSPAATKPAATPGKRGKVAEDPDGTLPLSE